MSRGEIRASINNCSSIGTMVINLPFCGITPPMVVTAISFTTPRTGALKVERFTESLRPATTCCNDWISALAFANSSRDFT